MEPEPTPAAGAPRLERPRRDQLRLVPQCLEALLGADHQARQVWAVVERLDLGRFLAGIKARGAAPGRPAHDPHLLIALWLYATIQGEGSARELSRLCEAHDAYRWLCGGVHVNYHTLAAFRVDHEAALDALFAQILTALLDAGVVTGQRVAVDGMRVRAAAGAASFRRRATLEALRSDAETMVARAKAVAADPAVPARRAAATQRAARERQERIAAALATLQELEAAAPPAAAAPLPPAPGAAPVPPPPPVARAAPRASTTDADARVMRMADGGYRPAYNVKTAVDTASRAIVAVGVSTRGGEAGDLPPLLAEVARRLGRAPPAALADGGHVAHAAVDAATAAGIVLYMPVTPPRRADVDPHARKPNDSEAVAAWRARMQTPEARTIYKERAATVETVNGDWRQHRGITQFPVRGMHQALCVTLWAALAYNILHFAAVLLAV